MDNVGGVISYTTSDWVFLCPTQLMCLNTKIRKNIWVGKENYHHSHPQIPQSFKLLGNAGVNVYSINLGLFLMFCIHTYIHT